MKKSLAASNPYLRDHALKEEMVKNFVESSSAIEGIHVNHRKNSTVTKKKPAKNDKA